MCYCNRWINFKHAQKFRRPPIQFIRLANGCTITIELPSWNGHAVLHNKCVTTIWRHMLSSLTQDSTTKVQTEHFIADEKHKHHSTIYNEANETGKDGREQQGGGKEGWCQQHHWCPHKLLHINKRWGATWWWGESCEWQRKWSGRQPWWQGKFYFSTNPCEAAFHICTSHIASHVRCYEGNGVAWNKEVVFSSGFCMYHLWPGDRGWWPHTTVVQVACGIQCAFSQWVDKLALPFQETEAHQGAQSWKSFSLHTNFFIKLLWCPCAFLLISHFFTHMLHLKFPFPVLHGIFTEEFIFWCDTFIIQRHVSWYLPFLGPLRPQLCRNPHSSALGTLCASIGYAPLCIPASPSMGTLHLLYIPHILPILSPTCNQLWYICLPTVALSQSCPAMNTSLISYEP